MLSNIHIEHLEDCRTVATYSNRLACPIVIQEQIYCVAQNGDIVRLNKKGETEIVFTILGQPSSLAFKGSQNVFLISDFAHQSIFSRQESSNFQIQNLITEYNDHAFLGPHSIKIGPFTKNIYFTDSGPFQETSIENKLGSVFVIKGENQKLKSLTFRTLAYPTGLELDQQEKYLLVCEMGENRILKYLLDDNFNGNSTIFHQFQGRFGPSAIFGYNSKFYIALYEFSELATSGIIAVLNGSGDMIEKLSVETGPQISGLYIYEESNEKQQEVILASEGNRIYRIPLKKSEEESKLEESIVLSKN